MEIIDSQEELNKPKYIISITTFSTIDILSI